MTTASPERPSSLTDPSSTNQESAPKHSPYVEVPPGRPPIDRHGQMASQLQDSKYEPRTSQSPKSIITASCRVAEAGCPNPTTRNYVLRPCRAALYCGVWAWGVARSWQTMTDRPASPSQVHDTWKRTGICS